MVATLLLASPRLPPFLVCGHPLIFRKHCGLAACTGRHRFDVGQQARERRTTSYRARKGNYDAEPREQAKESVSHHSRTGAHSLVSSRPFRVVVLWLVSPPPLRSASHCPDLLFLTVEWPLDRSDPLRINRWVGSTPHTIPPLSPLYSLHEPSSKTVNLQIGSLVGSGFHLACGMLFLTRPR